MSLGSCLVSNEPAGIGDAMIKARMSGKSWKEIAEEFSLPNPNAARKAFTKYTGLTDYKAKGFKLQSLLDDLKAASQPGASDAVQAAVNNVTDALSSKPAFQAIKTDPIPTKIVTPTVTKKFSMIDYKTGDEIWEEYKKGKTIFTLQYDSVYTGKYSPESIRALIEFKKKASGIGVPTPAAKVPSAIVDKLEDKLGITKEKLIDIVHAHEAGKGYSAIVADTGATFEQVDSVVWNHLLKKNEGYTWKAYLEKPTSKEGFKAVQDKIFLARSKGLTVDEIMGLPGAPPEGVIRAILDGKWSQPQYAGQPAIIPLPPPPPSAVLPSPTGAAFEYRTDAEMQKWLETLGQDLSDNELKALRAYTGSNYVLINGSLRGSVPMESLTQQYIRNIDNTMRPLPWDQTVVRQVTGENAFKGIDLSNAVGVVFEDKGFLSTTILESGVWSGNVQMVISVPKGAPARYVQNISMHKSEKELLLARSTKMIITRVDNLATSYGYNKWLVYAEVLV